MFLGSTDTVVYCTMGTSDVLTAALHIVLGKKSSFVLWLDVLISRQRALFLYLNINEV